MTMIAKTIAVIVSVSAFEAIFTFVAVLPVPAAVVFGDCRSRKGENRAGTN